MIMSWRMEWRDIPEAGTRSGVTSRLMVNAVLPQGDIISVMETWGYTYVYISVLRVVISD